MADMDQMETKNLIIRESTFDDCKLFAEWESTPDVMEFFAMDEDRNYENLVSEFLYDKKDPTKKQYTITIKPGGTPIGRIIITRIDTHYDAMDITRIYIADPELRGRGYGTEALKRLLEHAFIYMHMERVTIDHFTRNGIAGEVYGQLGFVNEGVMRHACKKDGKYYDLQLKSMIRSEYLERIKE